MLTCASSDLVSCPCRFVRMFMRCWPFTGMTFCSFWYSPARKYVVTSEPPAALTPVMRRLPVWRIPADLMGMLLAVESTVTQAFESPEVRRKRLQLVTRPLVAVRPYVRRLNRYSLTSFSDPSSPNVSHRVLPARPFFVVIWMTPFEAAVP